MNDMRNRDFFALFMPNQKRIFIYILKLVPNYSDAEDIMQEIAQLLLKKYSEYTPNTDFIAWALAIAKFKVLEYYKERQRSHQMLSKETVRILEKESSNSGKDYDSKLDALKKCIIAL